MRCPSAAPAISARNTKPSASNLRGAFRSSSGPEAAATQTSRPHFIGVFDTVAALGANGLRYFVIQAGLAAGVAAAAFAAGFLPAIGVALLCSRLGAGFMLSGFLAQIVIVAGARRFLVLAEQVDDQDDRRLP